MFSNPRFSWQLTSERRNVHQTAYEIQVAATESELAAGRKLIWDSTKITSDDSVNRIYDGPALKSGLRYFWHVRVWDESATASAWSETSLF